jgi:hypothetical protein
MVEDESSKERESGTNADHRECEASFIDLMTGTLLAAWSRMEEGAHGREESSANSRMGRSTRRKEAHTGQRREICIIWRDSVESFERMLYTHGNSNSQMRLKLVEEWLALSLTLKHRIP